MDKLQVSVACALLMILDPTPAKSQIFKCPSCPTGSYVTKNCTLRDGIGYGTNCARCSDCSGFLQQTVVPCSAYSDSVCMNRTTPIPPAVQTSSFTGTSSLLLVSSDRPSPPTVSPATMWTGLCAASLSLIVVLLVFTWMSCRNKGKFMKLLPLKPSSPEKKAPPPHQCDILIGVPV